MRRLVAIAAAFLSVSTASGCAGGQGQDRTHPSTATTQQVDVTTAITKAGDAAIRNGDVLEGVHILRNGYEHDPNATTATALAKAYRLAGEAQAGLVVLQEAEGRFAPTWEMYTEEGRCALADGYLPEAKIAVDKAVAAPGAKWAAWMVHGAYSARLGDYAAAEADFRKALALASGGRETMAAISNVALTKAERGDIKGAVADLEDVVRRPGVDPRIRGNLSVLYALSGDRAKFTDQLRRIALAPSDSGAAAAWAADLR
jgi:Flp pilus assembly protein TadD